MARQPRFVAPGQPQHIIQRGLNDRPVFIYDEDYQFYLDKLVQACTRYRCNIHAYVLMTNHIHILLTPETKQGVSKVIQSLSRSYVQYFNQTYNRKGTIWEGRYRAAILDPDEYLLICSRYIELNPVRQRIVKHPGDYKWSSYNHNAGLSQSNFLVSHENYLNQGNTDRQRQDSYLRLFSKPISIKVLEDIRSSVNGGWVLGNEKFCTMIERQSDRRAMPRPRGGDRRSDKYSSAVNRAQASI